MAAKVRKLRVVGGAQVRKQPLPVGRYWITIISIPGGASKLDAFNGWIGSNPTRVLLERAEAPAELTDNNGGFFIFRVLKPITFDQKQFGFPNDAGPEIQHASDTIQRPPVPKVTDILDDVVPAGLFDGVGSGVLLLVLAYFVLKD